MENVISRKLRRQQGQGMTEYLIVVALIAISAIVVFSFFGQTMRNQVAGMAKELAGQDSSGQVQAAQGTADKAVTNAAKTKKMSDYTSANDLQ